MVNYNDNAFLMGVSKIKHLYNIAASVQCFVTDACTKKGGPVFLVVFFVISC